MNRFSSCIRSTLHIVAGLTALALGGCGGFDGVQLNGKVFDAMGLNSGGSSGDPKMAQRSGIVVPPSTGALPVPGSRPEGEAPDVAALQDPDKVAKTSKAELQKQQDEYCSKNYEMAKARGDDNADLATGPLGPCRASALTALQNWQKGDKEDDSDEQQ